MRAARSRSSSWAAIQAARSFARTCSRRPSMRARRSSGDIVSAAQSKPGAINYGSAGVGSIAHLATELLDDKARIRLTHVPYKGAANAALDLAAGQIQLMISNYSTLAPLLKGGKIRAVAVTSAAAHPAFPDLPPIARDAVRAGRQADAAEFHRLRRPGRPAPRRRRRDDGAVSHRQLRTEPRRVE